MNTRRYFLILFLLMCIFAAAYAQDSTDAVSETTEPESTEESAVTFIEATAEATDSIRAQPVSPAIPAPTVELEPVIAPATDARLAVCSAPTQADFTAHLVQPGERLGDLLSNAPNFTVMQIATMNCIDDPNSLPVGSVVWLPAPTQMITDGAYFPEDTDPETDRAGILMFESSPEAALNQEGLTFSWDAVGTLAYFYACPPDVMVDGQLTETGCERPLSANPLPPTFTTPTIGDFLYPGTYRYRLEVIDGDAAETEDIRVEVVCSQRSLAPQSANALCPQNPPLVVFGAWEPFEGGVMLWFSDTREIYVMTNHDARVQVYLDPFVEGFTPNPDANAPSGLRTPARGFGQVWQALGGADESGLGWAMSEEIGIDSARQPAGRISYTTYIQGPGAVVYAVTLIPGTNEGFWTQVAG